MLLQSVSYTQATGLLLLSTLIMSDEWAVGWGGFKQAHVATFRLSNAFAWKQRVWMTHFKKCQGLILAIVIHETVVKIAF